MFNQCSTLILLNGSFYAITETTKDFLSCDYITSPRKEQSNQSLLATRRTKPRVGVRSHAKPLEPLGTIMSGIEGLNSSGRPDTLQSRFQTYEEHLVGKKS